MTVWWYQVIVPICVCVSRYFGQFAARHEGTSGAYRHVYYSVSELVLSDKALVGNDKRSSETTKPCRKQQRLVGKFILSWENLRRNISRAYGPCRKNDKHMRIGLCRFCCCTVLRKCLVDKTFLQRLSNKKHNSAGNNKALPETTKLCRTQQSFVGNDKAFFSSELSK